MHRQIPRPRVRRTLILPLAVLAGLLGVGSGVCHAGAWTTHVWRTDDGLPDNNVTGVAQAPDGAMILATGNGLARFDGLRIADQEVEAGVPRMTLVRALCIARDGAVWRGIDHGTIIRHYRATVEIFEPKRSLEGFARVICEDSTGAIWIGYTDGLLERIQHGQIAFFGKREGFGNGACRVAVDASNQVWASSGQNLLIWRGDHFATVAKLPSAPVSLCSTHGGGLWITCGTKLFRFDEKAGLVETATFPGTGAQASIWQLFEDRGQHLWAGSFGGELFRWTGREVERAATFLGGIAALADDREGNLWIGTQGAGLVRLRRAVIETLGGRDGIPEESMCSVCRDQAGRIWMTTQPGKLHLCEGGKWRQLESPEWPGGPARTVATARDGTVWIGTEKQGPYRWSDGAFKAVPLPGGPTWGKIRALLPARDGAMWVAIDSNLYRWRDGRWAEFPADGQTGYIQTLAEDVSGTIWGGTVAGRLLAVAGQKTVDRTPPENGDNAIRGILATPDGALWLGRAGDGLARLKNGRLVVLDKERGLPQKGISQLVPDARNRLWCGSDRGLFFVPMRELEAAADGLARRVVPVGFGVGEEMPSLQVNRGFWPNAMLDADGCVWLTMRPTTIIANPDAVGTNTVPPPVGIASVRVDDKPLPVPEGATPVVLSPRHHRIVIGFEAMSFVSPSNVRLRYRLDGLSDEWIESPPDRSASFSRLPAGDYTLRVIACNNDGVWNKNGASLALTVQPFFWATPWFVVLVFAIFAGILSAIGYAVSASRSRRRVAQMERQTALERERTRIARDMHDELGASLTQIAIAGKLARLEPEAAVEHIEEIAAIARRAVTALDEIVWAVDPRNDSLHSLLDYLCNYASEFLNAAGVPCKLAISDYAPNRPLSSEFRHHLFLFVKEALNNAVKYAGPGLVRLDVETDANALRLTVADSGSGFDPDAARPDSSGLRNMRARASELGGTCRIESQPGSGTRVIFMLPWAALKPIA